MVVINAEQGTKEWLQARAGRFTASAIWKLLTEPRAKKDKEAGMLSGTAKSYVLEKIHERLSGQPKESFDSAATKWGIENEPLAKQKYFELTGRKITDVGFIQHNDYGLAGASVDGLVSFDGIVEIKCPYSDFIGRVLENPAENKEYYTQMQMGLVTTGRQWCDYIIFDPRMPNGKQMVIQRILRDEEKTEEIASAISKAEQWVKTYMEEFKEKIFNTQKQSR